MEKEIADRLGSEFDERWLVYVRATPDAAPTVSRANPGSEGAARAIAVVMATERNTTLARIGLPQTAKAYIMKYARAVTNTVLFEEEVTNG